MVDEKVAYLMLSMFLLQCVFGIFGIIYGIILLIRKGRSFFYLFFTLGIWSLGAIKVWPPKDFSPIIAASMVNSAMICMVIMLYMHKRSCNKRDIK